MARKSKQTEAFKAYKETRKKKRISAIAYAKLRIINGVSRDDIIAALQERYGYTERYCGELYRKALQYYTASYVRDCEKIYDKNLKRLDAVVEAATEDDDMGTVMKAVDTLNKMVGAYTTQVEVKNNGDQPIFKIKIDE